MPGSVTPNCKIRCAPRTINAQSAARARRADADIAIIQNCQSGSASTIADVKLNGRRSCRSIAGSALQFQNVCDSSATDDGASRTSSQLNVSSGTDIALRINFKFLSAIYSQAQQRISSSCRSRININRSATDSIASWQTGDIDKTIPNQIIRIESLRHGANSFTRSHFSVSANGDAKIICVLRKINVHRIVTSHRIPKHNREHSVGQCHRSGSWRTNCSARSPNRCATTGNSIQTYFEIITSISD